MLTKEGAAFRAILSLRHGLPSILASEIKKGANWQKTLKTSQLKEGLDKEVIAFMNDSCNYATLFKRQNKLPLCGGGQNMQTHAWLGAVLHDACCRRSRIPKGTPLVFSSWAQSAILASPRRSLWTGWVGGGDKRAQLCLFVFVTWNPPLVPSLEGPNYYCH